MKRKGIERLRSIISEEVSVALREDYARGVPDFALSQVASEAGESLKRHLKRHIQQVAGDPVRQRQMSAAAASVVRELEGEMKDLLEKKLLQFLRQA